MHIYLALLPIPFSSETTWTFTFLHTRFIGNTSSAVVVVSRTQACSETHMRLSLASWFLLSGPLGWKCVPNKYFGLYWLKLWPLLPHSQTLHFLPQCCLRLSQIWTTNVGWARKKKNKEAFKNKNIIFSQTLLLSFPFQAFYCVFKHKVLTDACKGTSRVLKVRDFFRVGRFYSLSSLSFCSDL